MRPIDTILSVVSVTLVSPAPAKTAALIEMPFRLRTRMGPRKEPCDGGPNPPWEWAILMGKGRPIAKYRDYHPCVAAMLLFCQITLTNFGRPFVWRFALCYQTVLLSVCLSVLSVTLVHCGQTAGWIKMKLGMQVSIGPGRIVLDGTQLPRKMGIAAPQFSSHVYCSLTAAWIKMKLGVEVGLGSGHIVLDGDPPPPPKGAQPPNFQPISVVAKRSPISAKLIMISLYIGSSIPVLT